jgi:hypothetical protein
MENHGLSGCLTRTGVVGWNFPTRKKPVGGFVTELAVLLHRRLPLAATSHHPDHAAHT